MPWCNLRQTSIFGMGTFVGFSTTCWPYFPRTQVMRRHPQAPASLEIDCYMWPFIYRLYQKNNHRRKIFTLQLRHFWGYSLRGPKTMQVLLKHVLPNITKQHQRWIEGISTEEHHGLGQWNIPRHRWSQGRKRRLFRPSYEIWMSYNFTISLNQFIGCHLPRLQQDKISQLNEKQWNTIHASTALTGSMGHIMQWRPAEGYFMKQRTLRRYFKYLKIPRRNVLFLGFKMHEKSQQRENSSVSESNFPSRKYFPDGPWKIIYDNLEW